MSADLSEDPIVISMAARLGVDEFSVVGRLHRIWSWADRHLSDGLALGITPEWIDQFVRLDGFSNALLEAGWLSRIEKDSLLDSRQNLLDSFSETFLDSSRILLDSILDSRDGGGMGGVVFPRFFRFLSGRSTSKAKTKAKPTPTREREEASVEKHRESGIEKAESRKIEKANAQIEKEEAFSIFWKAYPRKDSKVPASRAFAKLDSSPELFARILEALEQFKRCDQWTREGGKFIPFASTWLNQRRWEDESTPAVLPQVGMQRTSADERRRAISRANGDAWLAQTPEFDPNVIDMEH